MGIRRAHSRTLPDGRTIRVRAAVVPDAAVAVIDSHRTVTASIVAADPLSAPPKQTLVPDEVTRGRRAIASRPLRPGGTRATARVGDLSTNPAGLSEVADLLAERFHDDPALTALLAERFPSADPVTVAHSLVEAVDEAWVETAVNNPLSDAVQRSISRVFDPPVPTGPTSGGDGSWPNTTGMRELGGALGRTNDPSGHDDLLREAEPLIDAYVQTQYAHTQRQFAERGITHLRLYRGMRWDATSGHPAVDVARRRLGANLTADSTERVDSNAASSWTLDVHTAEWFAGMGEPWPSDGLQSYGQLVDAVVPAESVWSVPATGPGDAREAEAIVIGAAGTVKSTWAELDDDAGLPDDDWWDNGPDDAYMQSAWDGTDDAWEPNDLW
ncbi:hypothetical protein DVS28_b0281 (plasmid) [Euzebya pacifica]|uniref:Uncharacterized protein n=1 Tax=Euzebya pacifica TaxID=1608957 RepID=A0A346Y6F4_9ACTN|nr:hypothetical protein [Euzebya pacifica]AXV10051.1 hypothetical protein DVS28_b0281 [Euzebya pacifica]